MKLKMLTAAVAVLGLASMPVMAEQGAKSENAERWMYENYGPRDNWPTYDTEVKHNKPTNREVEVGRPTNPNHPLNKERSRMGDH